MSGVYLDTSALAKLIVPEDGSDELERRLVGRSDLLLSDLVLTELASALGRRIRARELDAKSAAAMHAEVLADVEAGTYVRIALGPAEYREAERLLLASGRTHALEAGDALHLALAKAGQARAIVTCDRRLTAAAHAAGLATDLEPAGETPPSEERK